MGVIDGIKAKADELDRTYNPFRIVGDVLDKAGKAPAAPAAGKPVQVGEPVKTELIGNFGDTAAAAAKK